MKLATVFGAWSSNSLTVKVPSEVSNVAVLIAPLSTDRRSADCTDSADKKTHGDSESRRATRAGPTGRATQRKAESREAAIVTLLISAFHCVGHAGQSPASRVATAPCLGASVWFRWRITTVSGYAMGIK